MALDLTYDPNYGAGSGDLDLTFDPDYKPKEEPGFKSAIKRTAGQMSSAAGLAGEDVLGKNIITQGLRDWGQEVQEANPAGIQAAGDIIDRPGQWVKESTGSMLTQMGPQLAGGVAGRAIGGGLGLLGGPGGAIVGQEIGGRIGQAIPTFVQEYAGSREKQQSEGKNALSDKLLAAGAAVPATAIEFAFGPQRLLGRALEGALPEAYKQAAKGGGKEIAKFIAKEGAKQGAGEAMEEIPQGLLGDMAGKGWNGGDVFNPLTSPESWKDAGFSALMALPGGALLGGGMSGVNLAQAAKQNKRETQQPATQLPATPEDTAQMDALNADLGGAQFNYENIIPSEQKLLPPGVITVPNNAGGETVIDANAGPIQGAAVAAVTNSTIAEDIASGIPLKGYSPDQAKAELASRPDAERYEIRPHPVSGDRGRVAIVPKSAQALAEIDAKASAGNEAMARSEQLAAEEGTRKQLAQVAKDIQAAQKQAIDLHRSAASIEKSITPSTPPQDAAIAREQATELRSQAAAIQTQIQTARAAQAAAATQQATQGLRHQAEQNAPATEQALAQDAAQQELAPAVAQSVAVNAEKPTETKVAAPITPPSAADTKIDSEYNRLLSLKGTSLLTKHSDGRALYSIALSPAWRNKHMVGAFPFERFQQTASFEIKRKSDVTGNPSDNGFVLIDKREQNARRAPPQPTAKASTRRAGESESDWLYRKAAEKNAAKAQRQQQSEPVSEDQDVEAVRRAIGDPEAEVSVVSEDAMPDMDKAGRGQVSKQSATFMRHVAKMFGKEVVFVKGMEADGFYQKGNKLYLSAQSNVHHLRVLGHEMLHALKRQNRAAYDKLIEAVGAIATDAQLNGQFKDYYALDAEMSQKTDAEIAEWLADPKNREMILEEMMADLSGNRWAESSFWESVFTKIDAKYGSEQAKGIIAKLRLALVNALNKLMSLVKGGEFKVDSRVAEHLESIREALATGFADYAKAVKDKQIFEDGAGEAKLSKSKPTTFSDIRRGHKIEQAEPLSEKQWAQVREIALEELSKKDGQRALDAERDYLANEALANRDSERYKEVAREKLGSMAVPQLSTVPVMEGKVRPTIVGTGKNNKTRVFDVARVMRKRILARAADISNPEGRERIARALVHEALYSLSMDGHAVGWYDRKVREALAVTAMAHPEILTNKEANLAFRIIAAVTSNGQAVRDNFILANEIYKAWRSTGQFPVEFEGGGTRAPAMKAAFAKMNIMVGKHGWEKTQRELMTMRSVREIEQSFDLKINGELMDAMVPTAVGLGGPKIGNFFANLSGYFDSPTMDLWFMRTIGRMTGGIIATKPGLVKHLDKLLTLLPASGEIKGVSVAKMRKEIAEYKALSDEQRLDPEITIKVLGQVEKYGRAQYSEFAAPDADGKTFTQKTPENENARALKSNLSALVEAPSNGTQRDQLRQVVNRALSMLGKNGIKLNAADLQAVLWYYEKNLYAKLGDVSESAKPWDYASAARFGVGREYGLVDVGSSKRAGQVRDGQPGVREDDAGGMDEADGKADAKLSKARINFEVAPNPDDVALTNAWNDLPESKRHQLSVSIATDIANQTMRLFGVTGIIKEQQGGFEEETNTSFQLILDQPEKTGEVQNFLGYVLSQKSMVAVSEEAFPGSEKTGVVTVSVGDADPQAIYRQLRGIRVNGNQPVTGHSTAAGQMAILNYSDVSTEELARLIDSELRGKFDLHIDEVYTSFPEAEKTEDYGYGNNRQAREAAAGRPPLQGNADNLRRAATELIRKELKLSTRRSDAASDERSGGRDAADGIAIYGQASPGSVAAQGFHYSGAERKQLDGRYYGTGAKGREAPRVFAAEDKRLRERIYFYVDAGKGITPEQGVGAHGHTVNLNNLYDPDRDTFVQAKIQRGLENEAWLNAFESAVIDSGFDGYIRDFGTQRAVVLIGRHSVPVTYTGTGKQTGAVNAANTPKTERRTDLPMGQMTGAEWKKLEPRATDLEDGKSYYRSDLKFSPARVQSENELPNQQPGNRTLDGAELKALRRAASRLEDPERGVTFRVTEDGQAIVTGPARFHIPDRFQRFAEENGLTFKAERGSARLRPTGEPERTRLGSMPESYRGDGALYAQEMRDNYDRTGLTRFSPPRWYFSPLEKAFESAPDRVFTTAPQVKLWLAGNKAKLGLKDDEIFWTGINDWLDLQGKAKVSKAEVAGYLKQNGVRVEEVEKSGRQKIESVDEAIQYLADHHGWDEEGVRDEYGYSDDEDYVTLANDIYNENNQSYGNTGAPKYGQYVLPGGENYRELLLTLPGARNSADAEIAKLQTELRNARGARASELISKLEALRQGRNSGALQNEYRSGHWDEPNILAHIRFNERTDADGAKVLFIEEAQSDWGQEGKRRGFLDGNKARYEAEYRDYADELMAKYGVSPTSAGAIMSLRKAMSSDERAKLKELNDKIVAQSASVQSAPFVTDTKAWLALAVKRIMAYAAANGYEKVAFIDGQQSTDRYWKHELIVPAVNRWNEISKPYSVKEEVLHHIGSELASVTPLKIVNTSVLSASKNDQVARAVVQSIPVNVVDVLANEGFTPDQLVRDPDVVGKRLSVNHRSTVAAGLARATELVGTRLRAALLRVLSSESGRGNEELLPAVRASDLVPKEVMRLLSNLGSTDLGSDLGVSSARGSGAGDGAKQSMPFGKVDLAGVSPKLSSAELAKALNRHAEIVAQETGNPVEYVQEPPGEGMKAFYDRIVPQVVSDQLKKVGGKMEVVEISQGNQEYTPTFPMNVKATRHVTSKQQAFTVTPKMSGPLPLFSTRRALDGDFSDNDHVVPDIAPWTTNTQLVDLAYLNGKPIRLNVGRDNGPGSGFGAMHIARNEDRDPRRAVEKETDDRGENVVRSVLKALSTAGGILHKNGEKYVLRLPMANKALVLADNGNHYSVITVLPAAQNKYGVADWTGRLTFPATADATSAEPLSPTGAKSSLASRSGMGSFVSARFDIKPPAGFNQPTTRVVVRKTRAVDPEAMAADGIKRSIPRSQMTGQPILGTWGATEVSSFDNVARQLQDKQIDTKRVVAAIRAAGKAIHDAIDPYLQEILYHGRAAKRTQDFAEQELRPLLQGMQLRGVSMQEIEDYLWAKHAPERNAQNAKTGFKGSGSGLTDAEARSILSGQTVTKNGRDIRIDAAKMPTYAALAQQVKAINDKTLDTLVAYGLETQATIDQWKRTYQNYVPLMRDMTDDNYSGANNRGLGTGKGFSVRGAASKRALGSERGVIDIVANLAMQRERAITRGEKNRVSQATYGLAVSAPNPDFWLPIDPAMAKDTTAVVRMESALIQMGIHPIDAQNIAREPVQSYVDPRTGMAATRINPVLRGREDVLATRINGEDKFLLFSSDERAQNMVRNLKTLDDDQLGGFLQASAKITRWFAAVNTQYNPVFGLVNGVRDFGSAMLNLSSTPLQGKQKRVAGYGLDALRGIYADLRDHRAGRAPSSKWALEFEEFAKEGGQTGYRDMFNTSEQRTEALADELKALSQGNGKWLKINEKNPVFAWLSDYNTAVENAFRVAAYKVAKESGMSKQQAAALAKNLTVNFNKKGLAATQTGALYAFFNAAVQGTARIGSTLLEHRGDPSDYRNLRLSSTGKKIVLGGVMLGVMQALMGAMAGWDDDEPKQFQRERNLIIPLPGTDNYASIPYPLGFHVLPNVGRIVTEFALSGFKDPGKRLTQLLGSMSEAFNPLGSSGLSLQTIAPTFADPLVALATNTDWNGQKIAKEDFNQNHPTPGWSRTKDTATPWSKALAYGLNYISGGGEYGKGLASPTPDQIDYLIGQATGGVGREVGKVAQTVTATAKGEELPMYKIPVVGRFAGETTGVGPESGKYYDNLKRVGEHADPIKRMREDRKNAEVMEYFKAHPEARLIHSADKAQRDISELRTVKRKLEKAEAPQERINAISEQIKTRMRMFNNQVKLLEKEAA